VHKQQKRQRTLEECIGLAGRDVFMFILLHMVLWAYICYRNESRPPDDMVVTEFYCIDISIYWLQAYFTEGMLVTSQL